MKNGFELVRKVRRYIDRHDMIQPGDKVLVAVSGGSDSLTLLGILEEIMPEYRGSLHVFHLDHMMRGESSAKDALFVQAIAASKNIPVTVLYYDVPAYRKENKLSPEEAAREVRHTLMRQVAEEVGADKIAVGHTADDQAETFLMRVIRGTGTDGLRGIPPVNGPIIRPLLELWREDTCRYCQDRGLTPCVDESNTDERLTRNKIRRRLLPFIADEFNQSIKDELVREAESVSADIDFLEDATEAAWAGIGNVEGERAELRREDLLDQPLAIRRRLVRRAVKAAAGGLRGIDFRHVGDILEKVVNGQSGSSLRLPGGLIAGREYDIIYIEFGGRTEARKATARRPVVMKIPGITKVAGDIIIEAATGAMDTNAELPVSQDIAIIDAGRLGEKITVRPVKEGDRFHPLGMSGTKKVQDFFVDEKVPRSARTTALVVDSDGAIVWLVGYRLDHRYRVTDATKNTMVLHVRKETGG